MGLIISRASWMPILLVPSCAIHGHAPKKLFVFGSRIRDEIADRICFSAIRNIVLNLKGWIFGLWCWFDRVSITDGDT